jgi:hypothetical protein
MTNKAIYLPIIGDAESTYPEKKLIGADATMSWATRDDPADFGAGLVIFDDVGINGSLWYCDGVNYRPVGKPILAREARPTALIAAFEAADASTYSQVGKLVTITWTGHGITAAYDGSSLYIPVATGLLASGKYTNLTYVDANTLTVYSDVSQTTNGAIATNTVETTIASATVIGGLMGASGSINLNLSSCHDATATAKVFKIKYGSKLIALPSPTTTSGSKWFVRVNNNGAEDRQLVFTNGSANAANISYSLIGASGINAKATEDTSQDFTVLITATLAAGTWAGISDFSLELDR